MKSVLKNIMIVIFGSVVVTVLLRWVYLSTVDLFPSLRGWVGVGITSLIFLIMLAITIIRYRRQK